MVAVVVQELCKQLIAAKLNEAAHANLSSYHPRPAATTIQPKSPSHRPRPRDAEWVITIRRDLARVRSEEASSAWERLSVYRVPRCLRARNEQAYTPQVVSIGPLHHGKRRLREMEPHKWRALHHVLERTGHDISVYLRAVWRMVEKVRDCYDGRAAWMSSDKLVVCLVLDGTFVLEMFRGVENCGKGFVGPLGYKPDDPVFAMRGVMHAVRNDMILLENQIPLFVLERLHKLQQPPERKSDVASLAERFLQDLDPLKPTALSRRKVRYGADAATSPAFDPLSLYPGPIHCLDVFRDSLLHKVGPPQKRKYHDVSCGNV